MQRFFSSPSPCFPDFALLAPHSEVKRERKGITNYTPSLTNKHKNRKQDKMNNTTTAKLTAIFASNNAKFDKACAIAGIEHHRSCDNIVDTIHAFGSGKINNGNEEDAISSVVAGVVASEGHAPNHLDFATRAKESGVSRKGFFRAWNAGLKMMEDAGYCIKPAPSVRRKSAYLTKQDNNNTLKPIWDGDKKGKRKPRTMEQIVASLVKQHGLEAVVNAAENAA